MTTRYDIIQGTEEWHQIRYGKIGGTLSDGLFVKSDTLLINILSQQMEEFEMEDGYQSADMIRGNELEPLARQNLSEYLGVEILECGWLQSLDYPILGISPDGISKDETICCEIKSPGAKKHAKTILENQIPKDNLMQCLHYFTVNPKLERLIFCSFRPENKIIPMFTKELNRDSIISIGKITQSVAEWTTQAKKEAFVLTRELKEKLTEIENRF